MGIPARFRLQEARRRGAFMASSSEEEAGGGAGLGSRPQRSWVTAWLPAAHCGARAPPAGLWACPPHAPRPSGLSVPCAEGGLCE